MSFYESASYPWDIEALLPNDNAGIVCVLEKMSLPANFLSISASSEEQKNDDN